MRQQAINWWNKQNEYTQCLLLHLTFGRLPKHSVTERQVEVVYRSYFKL